MPLCLLFHHIPIFYPGVTQARLVKDLYFCKYTNFFPNNDVSGALFTTFNEKTFSAFRAFIITIPVLLDVINVVTIKFITVNPNSAMWAPKPVFSQSSSFVHNIQLFGRGTTTRTWTDGFGDRDATITPYPCKPQGGGLTPIRLTSFSTYCGRLRSRPPSPKAPTVFKTGSGLSELTFHILQADSGGPDPHPPEGTYRFRDGLEPRPIHYP